jgi:hypothetical protein
MECPNQLVRWLLLAITMFGLTVISVAIALTLMQLTMLLLGWWP